MGVTFTSEAAKKIKQAVRKVLSTPEDRTVSPVGSGAPETEFWAWITSATDLTGQRFAWVRVFPDFGTDDPDLVIGDVRSGESKWKLFEPKAFGWGTAYEANGGRGLSDVVVKLTFAGYRKPAPEDQDQVPQPVYVFTHQSFDPNAQQVGIHDHRDNFNGGFSFAVYHPGTGLPQQKWYP